MNLYKHLVKKFKRAGIPKKYLEKYLMPYWWDKSLRKDDSSVTLAMMYLSDLLHIDLAKLCDRKTNLRKELIKSCNFKKSCQK